MIYITGDIHGIKDSYKFKQDFFQNTVNKEGNYLIILGDAGFTWLNATNAMIDFFKSINLKCKVLSILGNNDNYDDIYSRKQFDYAGGKAVCIDGNNTVDSKLMYLMNGYVYNLENKKFAVLGGADSYDAPFRCEILGEMFFSHPRIEHQSWWKEELPSVEDYYRLKKTLIQNKKVDFMLSHDATTKLISERFGWSVNDNSIPNKFNGKRDKETKTVRDMNNNLQKIMDCKMWFFGHHHKNVFDDKQKNSMMCLFDYFADINKPEKISIYNPNGMNVTERILKNKSENFNF